MDPMLESALIAAAATIVGVGGTVVVAVVTTRTARSTNQATLDSAADTTKQTIQAVRETNQATIAATRAGQIADLYSRAIDQLGSEQLNVRIGGIYALERVARQSEEDHPIVMDVLTAFIREYSRDRWPPPERHQPKRWTRPDVQAAVTVVGRREVTRDTNQIDLFGAILISADLKGADLRGASLSGADLTGAHLANARLDHADLRGVTLDNARLRSTDLSDAMWSKDKPVPEGWEIRIGADGVARQTARQ
jgi:Pentapeptide repeats (8 copies)